MFSGPRTRARPPSSSLPRGNPHVVAVAALFSPLDPYRELFYPGGCATGSRFARWMCESQIKDGVAGALERLSELTGVPTEELPVARTGQAGRRAGRYGPARGGDRRAPGKCRHAGASGTGSFQRRPPARPELAGHEPCCRPAGDRDHGGAPTGPPAGWQDAAFASGALRRFANSSTSQQVEIGPWGHGGGTYTDTLRPAGTLDGDLLSPEGQDRRLVEFFTRYLERGEAPDGERRLTFATLGTDQWQTVGSWPPGGAGVRTWYLACLGRLALEPGAAREGKPRRRRRACRPARRTDG